ncbi:villin-3 isoform X2 [Arabidopsis lyrata subsp. lyrata]|uniref:villin-3 isoform X2 n=1 Tax=Arabidopsis lyrata subsp. lyrata TaxID=81972 RepID=UPI000A29CC74|nr:villin-3 isoform X2 [Arabidopsis lyrata subsp. lyrata]|eukprot:XP_020877593.1 villin-3 isoform X2 [Arabidopsis lyrata subsp. lyrata]
MTEKGLSDKTYTMESIEMEVTIMRHYKLKRLKRFTTFDLLTEEMHLIMLKFIEVGQCVDPKEKQTAFEISQFCEEIHRSHGFLECLVPKSSIIRNHRGK